MIDDSQFGKAIKRLSNAWTGSGIYSEWACNEYKQTFLEEREESYQNIALAYISVGQAPPPGTILSGD